MGGFHAASLDSGLVSDQPLLELERSTAHVYLAILMRAHLQLHSGTEPLRARASPTSSRTWRPAPSSPGPMYIECIKSIKCALSGDVRPSLGVHLILSVSPAGCRR